MPIGLALLALSPSLCSGADEPIAVHPVYDTPDRVSLHGRWQFRLETQADASCLQTDYEPDSSWGLLPVPGNWETHGLGEFSYGRGSAEVGLYRRWLNNIPARWRGMRVCAYFEGAYAALELWVNGQPVGRHEGGYTSTGRAPSDPDTPNPRPLAFKKLPARQTAGEGWVWAEAEDFTDCNWQRNGDTGKAA